MIIKIAFCGLCSLFIVPALNGMHKFKNTKEKNPNQEQASGKTELKNIGDKDKLIDFRNQYRNKKHTGFAEEHNKQDDDSKK